MVEVQCKGKVNVSVLFFKIHFPIETKLEDNLLPSAQQSPVRIVF